jgi:basic membrane lipoprotein Med (substrate-binding protein (PBP1-ABC) superfamily)
VGTSKLLKQSVALPSTPSRWVRAGRWLGRRWPWPTAVSVLLIAVLVWASWPGSPQRHAPDPRSRQFSTFTVCVLTGSRGITDPQTAPVWDAVADASKATGAQGSYLSVPAPDTLVSAETYVDTLTSRRCSLVVTTGVSEAAAVDARAAKHSSQRFVVVGASRSAANVQVIPFSSASAVRCAVASAIEQAASGR